MFTSLHVPPNPPGCGGRPQHCGVDGAAALVPHDGCITPHRSPRHVSFRDASCCALLFPIYYVFACSDLFVYCPPSLANFPTRIAFIHESPPFLSLTRARSHCRREEARTLFPLFKVSRSVPGPSSIILLSSLPSLFHIPCLLLPCPSPGCRGRGG